MHQIELNFILRTIIAGYNCKRCKKRIFIYFIGWSDTMEVILNEKKNVIENAKFYEWNKLN